jgi:DNA-directed RNA polymerase specialized sigma24 family protein
MAKSVGPMPIGHQRGGSVSENANSVIHLIGQLEAGDEESAQQLWQEYFHRLVALARTKLHGNFRRTADEEDIALSAFASFCRGVEAGRFPKIQDRDNLWQSLFALVSRKSAHHHRDRQRQKRDDRRTLDEAALDQHSDGELDLNTLVGKEPTPEFAAEIAEECERQLMRLDDDGMRKIAAMKMEGFTNTEIAERLQLAPRTIERRLRLIRNIWMASPDS